MVHVSFGGGFTVPNSEVADRLGNGYNFNFGIDTTTSGVRRSKHKAHR
jgi:hypothetical protein